MAEVLITLGIIGVVVAITIPSLVTKINNKGYAERFLKTYSLLQTVTNKIIEEEGMPKGWGMLTSQGSTDESGNKKVFDMYKNHLNIVRECINPNVLFDNPCALSSGLGNYTFKANKYVTLNNQAATGLWGSRNLWSGYDLVLADGTLICLTFKYIGNGVCWDYPSSLVFEIDVNGKKAPNKLGRDIFFVYLDEKTGKVLPFGDKNTQNYANTCDLNSTGHSCAYRIVTEGKMNY